jgi:hypothetical protein
MSADGAAQPAARDTWIWLLIAEAAILLAVLAASGALAGSLSPDTQSYFAAAASPNPWGEPRHPLYGWLADLAGGSATGVGLVAGVQAVLHVVAVLVLYAGARFAGVGRIATFALATAALLSQSDLYHVRLVIPEAPANACLLAALGLTLAATRSMRALCWLVVPTVLLAGVGYLLRPTQLPAIVILPALYFVFAWRQRGDRRVLAPLTLTAALAVPFLAQASLRLHAVGDFNIVSFGGYQMSGLAAFMLTPDIVARVPDNLRPLAQAALDRRRAAEAAGVVPATPRNAAGARSFASAALGYFDIYARGYDDVLGQVIMPLWPPGESWVGWNRRLMDFSLATVRADPAGYLAWVAGATARLAGRAIVANAPMMIALALWLTLLVVAFMRRRDGHVEDIGAVTLLALGWLACNGVLPVLVTFPAARYVDTAAILLPAIPLTLAIALATRLRTT